MKILQRGKLERPIQLEPQDTIKLIVGEIGARDGELAVFRETTVLEEKVKREMILNETVIFDVEKGDFEGVDDGIGGAFLSCKKGGE